MSEKVHSNIFEIADLENLCFNTLENLCFNTKRTDLFDVVTKI